MTKCRNSKLIQAKTLSNYILEAPSSIIGWDIDCPEIFVVKELSNETDFEI
jgi:hypothetical protein